MLIVMSGPPGSGKSAVADAIGRARRCPVLSVDPIESAIVRSGVGQSFETGLAAYLVVEALADEFLSAGLDVVIDAANAVEPGRDLWRRLATRRGVDPVIIDCAVPDAALHQARLSARDRGLAIAEPDWASVERQRDTWAPWPEPHLTLDGTESVAANVTRALTYLDGRR